MKEDRVLESWLTRKGLLIGRLVWLMASLRPGLLRLIASSKAVLWPCLDSRAHFSLTS